MRRFFLRDAALRWMMPRAAALSSAVMADATRADIDASPERAAERAALMSVRSLLFTEELRSRARASFLCLLSTERLRFAMKISLRDEALSASSTEV